MIVFDIETGRNQLIAAAIPVSDIFHLTAAGQTPFRIPRQRETIDGCHHGFDQGSHQE